MNHFPEALGWTLLHFIWQAAVIAILYRLLDWRLERNRADVRYSVALIALLCMLGTSIATLIYEYTRLGHTALAILSGGSISRLSLLGSFPQYDTDQLLRWIDSAWLIGVFFFALRALGGAWKLKRFRSMLSFEAVGDVAARFSAVAQRMEVKSQITLRIHPAAETPFVAGLFRSVVYLPISALTSLTPDQLDTILIHELAHVRRADYAWNLVQSAMETLFFFHPAVWWLGKILRERRELCCDDIVVELCSSPFTYAKALLALAEHQEAQPRFAMALDGHQGHNGLFARIARILGEAHIAKGHSGTRATSRLLISLITGAVVLYVSHVTPPHAHVPVVHAGQTAQLNTSLPSPSDITGIRSNELHLRLRRSEVAELKEPATTVRRVAPADQPRGQRSSLSTADYTALHDHTHEHPHPHEHHHHHDSLVT